MDGPRLRRDRGEGLGNKAVDVVGRNDDADAASSHRMPPNTEVRASVRLMFNWLWPDLQVRPQQRRRGPEFRRPQRLELMRSPTMTNPAPAATASQHVL